MESKIHCGGRLICSQCEHTESYGPGGNRLAAERLANHKLQEHDSDLTERTW